MGSLEGDKNFDATKAEIVAHFGNNPAEVKKEMELFSDVWDIDKLEQFETPKCSNCGDLAQNRCSKCKSEWYCGRECQVAHWKKHKDMCKKMAESQMFLEEHKKKMSTDTIGKDDPDSGGTKSNLIE